MDGLRLEGGDGVAYAGGCHRLGWGNPGVELWMEKISVCLSCSETNQLLEGENVRTALIGYGIRIGRHVQAV